MRLIPRLIAALAAVGLAACATPIGSQPQATAPVTMSEQEAFVIAAKGRDDFVRAMREKMILEVAWDRPANLPQAAQD